eukprot:TRINITY_DN2496_c0_g1_i2.p1 TRINITY_DN2496_c0_g1~~TRINITY_DN2496_c0_g1_i2.p1  ORF type:complete len:877 (-),score=346.25 TRINITY_DN2496_c0_g1_i2:24-2654(-)
MSVRKHVQSKNKVKSELLFFFLLATVSTIIIMSSNYLSVNAIKHRGGTAYHRGSTSSTWSTASNVSTSGVSSSSSNSEQSEEEEPLRFSVEVKNFADETTDEQLNKLFSTVGAVLDMHRKHDFNTLALKRSAYVSFATEEEADLAVLWYNNMVWNGEKIQVSIAHSSKRVIVVGAGLAGLSAALAAAEEGASVVILEKEMRSGGNSAKASSGMNAMGTPIQEAQQVQDTLESFVNDTIVSGADQADPKLVKLLAKESKSAWDFLTDMGIDLSELSRCGGHSYARTHRGNRNAEKPVNVGWSIISNLLEVVEASPSIRLINGATVTALITKDNSIVRGCEVELAGAGSICMIGEAVVITTGGFSQSKELLEEYRPDLVDVPSTNGPFAQGEGIKLCTQVGAMAVQMDSIQLHPTGFVDPSKPDDSTKFLAPEALRACGAILVNDSGKRFINELEKRDVVSAAIKENCNNSVATLIMDEAAAERFGNKIFGFYKNVKKFFVEYEGVAAIAEATGMSVDDVRASVESTNGSDEDAFGNPLLSDGAHGMNADGKLFVAQVIPSIHYTMGGVAINSNGQVLSKQDMSPIAGLFAAGEVTGGIHGANRLAGNSLLECVVFGRRAGQHATLIYAAKPALSPNKFVALRFREAVKVSPTTSIFRFDLPDKNQQVGLSVGQYIATRATLDGEEVVRFYSPLSRPDNLGVLELLVKITAGGTMTEHMSAMQAGDELEFKGPIAGLELDVGTKKRIGMLAGGTGIAPMIQIIRAHLLHERKMGGGQLFDLRLVFGAKDESELVLREALSAHMQKHSNLSTWYVLNEPPEDWDMGKGFITKEIIEEQMPPPGKDTLIVVCGPPIFCKVMRTALTELGYVEGDDYFSFL